MKGTWTRILGGTLCLCMMVTMFTGCGDKNKEEDIKGSASKVAYNAQGKYTTTLTAEAAKFSEDLSAADVKVKYGYMDSEAYNKAIEESGKTFPELNAEDYPDDESYQKAQQEAAEKFYKEAGIDPNKYMNWYTPSINSLTRKDDKTLEVSFTDADAVKFLTDGYIIEIPADKAGGKAVAAYAVTAFPDHTATPEVSAMSAFDNDIKVTLVLAEGSFAENVTADKIRLGNSFSDMKIESLSCAGKNLTVQLTGELKQSETSSLYMPGEIEIDKSALVNGYKNVYSYIDIETQSFGFDFSNMKVSNGTVTAPFEMKGLKLADSAKASDFTLDGAKVSGFEKKSGSAGVLTIAIAGATDKNSACKLLDGKEMNIAKNALANVSEGTTVVTDFAAASFYPVFDYAEEKDGKYSITAVLYANSGTFTDKLDKRAVSFANDFAGAAVTSIKKDSATTATLIFTVDSKGVSVEEMDLTGTITLTAGTLKNRWGDNTSNASSYTRGYQNETMGKFAISGNDSLTTNDLENIQSIVGGFGNTTIGTLTASASGIASAASGIVSILELTGVIESEKVKLDKIYKAVVEIQKQIELMNDRMDKQESEAVADKVYKFYAEHLLSLLDLCIKADGHVDAARRKVLGTHMDTVKNEDGKEETVEVANEPKTTEEFKAVWKEASLIGKEHDTFTDLEREWGLIKNYLKAEGTNMSNPLNSFDKYMANIYNFDTQASKDRQAFGTLMAYALTEGAAMITSNYQYGNTVDTKTMKYFSDELDRLIHGMPKSGKLEDIKNSNSNGILTKYLYTTKPRTDGYVYSYVRNQEFHNTLAWAEDSRYGIASKENDEGGCDDWSDAQISTYLKRMNVRGLRPYEELDSAGITVSKNIPKNGIIPNFHCFFRCWREWDWGYEYHGVMLSSSSKGGYEPWAIVQHGAISRWWKK